ncbi:MAG: helix-turn-helix domain-containing protein [Candidatus Bathyarchaeia archaeon]
MRRLILEVCEKELAKIGVDAPAVRRIKSLQLLNLLKHSPEEIAAVWRVEFKRPTDRVEDLLAGGFLVEVHLLHQEENGAYIVFMRSGPSLSSTLNLLGKTGGYLFPPLDIHENKLRISFLGSAKQVKRFLEEIEARGIRYKIFSVSDANFSPLSPLGKLTDRQRNILLSAYKYGYYDVPRRINSEQLARKLNIADSTLIEHLRKTEKRLIMHILTQS